MSRDIYKQTHYIYATSLGINMVDEAVPDGVFHISEGSAGSISVSSYYSTAVLESSGRTGLTILAPDNDWAGLNFASPSDNMGALVVYKYNDGGAPTFRVGTTAASGMLKLVSGNNQEAVYIDSSQNVGVRTSNPDTELHVYPDGAYADVRIGDRGTIFGSASTSVTDRSRLQFIANGNSNNVQCLLQARDDGSYTGVQLGTNNAHPLAFYTNNTTRMTLDSTGKVGVNTASPDALLHLHNPVDIPALHISSASSSEGDVSWPAAEAFSMGEWDGSTFTSRVHIDTDGEVGIGTTSPGARLHVKYASNEQLRLENSGNYVSLGCTSGTDLTITSDSGTDDTINLYMDRVRISDGGTGTANLYMGAAGYGGNIRDGDGNIRIAIFDGGDLQLRDDTGTSRLVIGGSGDTHAGGVGIGTSDPDYDLHVTGTESSSYIAMIDNQSTGSNADVLILRTGPTTATSVSSSNNFIQFQDGNGDTMGSIEGSTGTNTALWGTIETTGNIVLMGAGSDYGEWLPVANINDWPNAKEVPDNRLIGLEEGTVVFVKNGLINPKPPGLPMVITERSIITGNSPGGRGYSGQPGAVLSFIGQVFVKISGDAKEGDFIIPSDNHGTCRAVSRDSITFEDYINSIGVVLEDGPSGYDVSKVRCAIGVKNGYQPE